MLQPPSGLIGKCSVPVVDVDDIVGRDIVGDIDVRPAISVQVGDGDAESIAGIAQYAGFPRHIGELPWLPPIQSFR